jgi:hypothetical protein
MTYDEKNLEKLPAKGILSDRWGSWASRVLKKGTGSERPIVSPSILVCREVPVPFFNTLLD